MSCDSRRRKAFQGGLMTLAIGMIVYALWSGRYSIGALAVVPAVLFVYAECGSLPFDTCDVEDGDATFSLKRKP